MTTPAPSRRLIVATDFSSRADRAIDRALQMGRDNHYPIRFLYALEPGKRVPMDSAEVDRHMEQCVGYPAGTDQGGGPIEYAYPEGSPPVAIAQACEAEDASLLLIGPARYNSFGDFFMGTAVDYVLRNTTKPVLIVKKRVRDDYDQIVAGTDFSAGSAHAIIEASKLFPNAKIHVTHAWHVPFEGFQRDGYVADETEGEHAKALREFVAKLNEREPGLPEITTGHIRGGPFDAVRDGLESYPNALVVLDSHGASGFKEATLGSNTGDILRFVEADMLVVNTKAAKPL
ncbi:MAG: universal stress protein [Pseudomonadota bacterium]